MKIWNITDDRFRQYGREITGINWEMLLAAMEAVEIPEGVIYEPSVPELEATPVYEVLRDRVFGELPIQIGYCNGHNDLLNAVEYHRSSEVNVAATDLILLLGKQRDIGEDFTYQTSLVEAFFVPAGTGVELYADTLHYAPCSAGEGGFKDVIVLLRDTNLPLERSHGGGEDSLLAARNKWLIGHRDAGLAEGTHLGLTGDNISVKN